MNTQKRKCMFAWMGLAVLVLICRSEALSRQTGIERLPIQIANASFEGLNYRAEGETVLDRTILRIDVKVRFNPIQLTADQTKIHRAIQDLIARQVNASLAMLLEDRNIDYTQILEDYPVVSGKASRYLSDRSESAVIGMPMPNLYQAEFSMPFDGPGGIAEFILATGIDQPEDATQEEPVKIVIEPPPPAADPVVESPPVIREDSAEPERISDPPADVEDETAPRVLEIIPFKPSGLLGQTGADSESSIVKAEDLGLIGHFLCDIIARKLSNDTMGFEVFVKSPHQNIWKTYGTEETSDVETVDADLRFTGEIVEAGYGEGASGTNPFRVTINTMLSKPDGEPLWQKPFSIEESLDEAPGLQILVKRIHPLADEIVKVLKTSN